MTGDVTGHVTGDVTRDVPGHVTALDRLAGPSDRRVAVRVTKDALRQLRGGSPWLFDGSITSAKADGARAGDLAVVFDDDRRFAAIGLWDPGSPIRVRVLHTGAPTPIDDAWWHARVASSIERRGALVTDPDTTGFRLVHGENDGLGGLVVDRYADTLVVKLYTAAWWPHLGAVVRALIATAAPERIVLRLARSVAAHADLDDGDTIHGVPPDGPVRFRERGLAFEADVVRGHKTGHYLDQRDNRGLVRSMAAGCSVLDVFANTGGFSVSAAAGLARSVDLVDVSEAALAAAERNLGHNRHIGAVKACAVRTTAGDAFDVLADLARRDQQYDVVVVDPPSFAHDAAGAPAARRAYGRLTRAAVRLVAPGGHLVQASCSSRVSDEEFFTTVRDAAASAGVTLREIRRTGHPVDHPIGFPQGAYLKAVFAAVT